MSPRRSGCLYDFQFAVVLFLCFGAPLLAVPKRFALCASNFAFPQFLSVDQFITSEDVQYSGANSSFTIDSAVAARTRRKSGNSIGSRFLFRDKVQMRNETSKAVASFNTSFTFRITPKVRNNSNYNGQWRTKFLFTFASENTTETTGDFEFEGGARVSSKQLFAVEFGAYSISLDRYSQNGSHIFNLCGGRSTTRCSTSWTGRKYTSWIDYNAPAQSLELWISRGSIADGVQKPGESLFKVFALDLSAVMQDFMYVGFRGLSSGRQNWTNSRWRQNWTNSQWMQNFSSASFEFLSWNFESRFLEVITPLTPQKPLPVANDRSSRVRTLWIMSVPSAVVAIAILVAISVIARRRSRWRKQPLSIPCSFTFKELSRATKDFSDSAILGSGGFGAVYKGTLSPSGFVVAVKRLKSKSGHGEKAFFAEASSVSQIRHPNLVRLQGWCHEERNFLLVYDYMCNGSLDEWLFPSRRQKPGNPKYKMFESVILPWSIRASILAGVAAALEYLHEDWTQCVLHRDVKSSNVMLDENFTPHLGDFGLARLMDHQKLEKTTKAAGTLSYMAPELPYTGKATKESDVYSFGILVLEVVCGRRPINLQVEGFDEDFVLLQIVWRAHENGNILSAVDKKLLGSLEFSDQERKMMVELLQLGLLCCLPNPKARPSMRVVKQVIAQLTKDPMSTIYSNLLSPLPSCRPLGRFPATGMGGIYSEGSVSQDTLRGLLSDRSLKL